MTDIDFFEKRFKENLFHYHRRNLKTGYQIALRDGDITCTFIFDELGFLRDYFLQNEKCDCK